MTEAGPGLQVRNPFLGQGRPRARVREQPMQELRHRLRREMGLGLTRRVGPNPDEPPLIERRIHHRPRFRPRTNHHAHFHHAVDGLRRHLALPEAPRDGRP